MCIAWLWWYININEFLIENIIIHSCSLDAADLFLYVRKVKQIYLNFPQTWLWHVWGQEEEGGSKLGVDKTAVQHVVAGFINIVEKEEEAPDRPPSD